METSTKKNPLINIVTKLSKSLFACLKHEQRGVVPDRYVMVTYRWTGQVRANDLSGQVYKIIKRFFTGNYVNKCNINFKLWSLYDFGLVFIPI